MLFLVLMSILQASYHQIILPVIINHYTYIFFALWLGLVTSVTYVFLYLKDKCCMQYLYKNIAISTFKSAGCGLFFATLSFGLYNQAVLFAAHSKFFTPYKNKILNMATYIPGQAYVSQTLEQRILTILFLFFSSLFALYFVTSCSYQLQDHKNYQNYQNLIFITAFFCYVVCMFLGYI